jgi:hypothetical protein
MIPRSLRFVAIYAILLIPWPAFDAAAGAYVRDWSEWLYGGTNDRRELDFETAATPAHPGDLRVVIVNRALMTSAGAGPVQNLDLDAAGLVCRPLALICALIACTPLSWKRRFTALLWCLLWEHVIVLGTLGFCIWMESAEVSLVSLTPFWKHVAIDFREMLAAQLGLVVPILLWIVVVFRRSEGTCAGSPAAPWVASSGPRVLSI